MKSTTKSTATRKTARATKAVSTERPKRSPVHRSAQAATPVTWPSDDAIRARAYALFEQRGHVHGHDVEDWLEAERVLHAELG
jgi:hypothetical protein